MQRLFFSALILAFGGVLALGAGADAATYELDPQKTELHFDAKSTLHPFRGDAAGIRGRANWDRALPSTAASGEVAVPVAQILTREPQRDKEMRQMFGAEKYPDIIFKLSEIRPTDAAGGAAFVLEGSMRIREITKPVSIPATVVFDADGVRVHGSISVLTTWFDLKPPSVLGFIRVLPEVKIVFDSYWRQVAA